MYVRTQRNPNLRASLSNADFAVLPCQAGLGGAVLSHNPVHLAAISCASKPDIVYCADEVPRPSHVWIVLNLHSKHHKV